MKKIKNSLEFVQINRIKNDLNCGCNSSDDCSCGEDSSYSFGSDSDSGGAASAKSQNDEIGEKQQETAQPVE